MTITDIILSHSMFFLVGIFQDIFITFYYQNISKEQAWRAAFFSSTVTLINIFILYKILTGIEDQVLSIIIAYAVGNGVGTLIVLKRQKLLRYFAKKTGL